MNPRVRIGLGLALLLIAVGAGAWLMSSKPAKPRGSWRGMDPLPQAGKIDDKPPVVLITIDTLRADHLGTYGYFRETAPNITAFGKESVLFENAVSTAGSTTPSHTSMLTGMYPHQHGIISNTQVRDRPFRSTPQIRSVAELFRDEGYDTAAFVSGSTVKSHTGLDAGFGTFDQPERSQRVCEETVEQSMGWLKSQGDRPYFLWIHLWDPHAPMEPGEKWTAPFANDPGTAELLEKRQIDAGRIEQVNRRKTLKRFFAKKDADGHWGDVPTIDTAAIIDMYNRYDGEIARMDACVGQILGVLKSRNDYDRAITVLTSDHGQSLGHHDWLPHTRLTPPNVNVPLVMHFPPGVIEPQRLSGVVSHIDMMPTVFARFTSVASEMMAAQTTGSDLLSGTYDRGWAFSIQAGHPMRADTSGTWGITSTKWRYEFDHGSGLASLYDQREDPLEAVNMIDKRKRLARRLRRLGQRTLTENLTIAEIVVTGASEADEERVQQELSELGYMDEH